MSTRVWDAFDFEKRASSLIATCGSAATAVGGIVVILYNGLSVPSRLEWMAEYVVLFSLFYVLSLALPVLKRNSAKLGILGSRLFIFFLISFPDGRSIAVRYLLFASLMIDASANLPFAYAGPSLLFGALSFMIMQHWDFNANIPVRNADLAATLTVILSVLFAAILLSVLRRMESLLATRREANDTLHSAVLQLTSANTAFLRQASVASEESAADERNRITRELHDVIGQTLTNIIMMMDAALYRTDASPQENRELLVWTREQAQHGLVETRAALYELRSLRYDNLRGIKAIKKMADTFSLLSKIRIKIEWETFPGNSTRMSNSQRIA
jgi:signal transduction histidine kinase